MTYRVVEIREGGISVIFLGSNSLPLEKLETELNDMAAQGWRLVFQVIEKKRFLLFWNVDRLVLTFAKD